MSAVRKTYLSPSLNGATPYRKDIDGLRAVAVLLVVVYHVWIGRVSGGVDAFLMISAYFLTGSLIRRVELGKPLGVIRQWNRTFKRLLPPAAVVLTATAFVGFWLLPGSRLPSFFRNLWSSLFYVENWRLAIDSADYYADKSEASPVQHFWSLGVQGQVFILWPLIFVLIALLARRFVQNIRVTALLVLSLVFVSSLIYSIWSTSVRQDFAYFDTGARLWEFAAGGILAIVLPWLNIPRRLRVGLGWIGLVALISCGMVLDVQGGFPGYLALWPVLSVALIIVAGAGSERPTPVTKFLGLKPVVELGKDAYALYLVHWPVLVFAIVAKHGKPLTFFEGFVVILSSLVLARLITWLVDDRIRYAQWANTSQLRGLLVIVLSLLLASASIGSVQWSVYRETVHLKQLVNQADPAQLHPGAAALTNKWTISDALGVPPIPLADEAEGDWGSLPDSCDGRFDDYTAPFGAGCSELKTDAPSLKIALAGDSHLQQWLPAFAQVAKQADWHLLSFLKGACPIGLPDPEYFGDPEFAASCIGWNLSLLDLFDVERPDVVVIIGSRGTQTDATAASDAGEQERTQGGQEEMLDALQDLGIPVVFLRDNPRFTYNVYECAEQLGEGDFDASSAFPSNPECGVPRNRALAKVNPAEALIRPGVSSVDMSDFICPEDMCPAIIGNVFVYLDDNHLTASYTTTMAPMLAPRLIAAVEEARAGQLPKHEPGFAAEGEEAWIEPDWEDALA